MVVVDFGMNLPHGYYPAIGEFMFRSAQLEAQMHQVLWRVLDLDNKQGRILTAGTDFNVIRAQLRTAVSDEMRGQFIPKKEKALIQEINYLVNKSKEHLPLRNRLAHCGWEYPIGGKPSDIVLVGIKEYDEKYLARFYKNVDDAYLHKQSAILKSLNMRAKILLFDLCVYRGINTASSCHSRKDFR